MNRVFSIVGILVGLASVAHAQATSNEGINPYDLSIAEFNPEAAVAPTSIVEGPGIKIGEGTVLHPVLGAETGVISNVFYANTQTQSAGLLRLMAQIGAASLGGARLDTSTSRTEDGSPDLGRFEYRLNLLASYDFMLSGDSQIQKAGGLGLGAGFHGIVNPMGGFAFGIDEDYMRLIRAADFESDANLNRDINTARLVGMIHPRGRSLSGYVYYMNTLDIFEQSTNYPDRMSNTIGLHPMWQWLPQTQVYMDASWGVVSSLGNSTNKVTSYPLSVALGLGTLLTYKTTLNLSAGYTNGFYSKGPSFSAPELGATFGYRYSPLGRVLLGYQLMYSDSINANYYRDHIVLASLQQFYNPVVFMVQPELHLREYNGVNIVNPQLTGPNTRDDTIFAVTAGVSYAFRNWFAATLSYRFSSVQTSYTYMLNGEMGTPSFARHEALLGVRAAM